MQNVAEFIYRHRILIMAIWCGLILVVTADGVLP